MEKKIIFMDVDDVCALLSQVWLARYNKDYNDNLTDKDITDWSIDKFVKPECGIKIYKYLEDPTLYDNIKPREGAVEGIEALKKMGYRVIFSTSCPIEVAGRKFYWLQDNGFTLKEREYTEIRDKSLLKGEYMFDDSYDNVAGFSGEACLLTRPWNEKYSWNWRVKDWDEYISQMKKRILCPQANDLWNY